MKPIIIAKNKSHLTHLIWAEIDKNGNECNLNHIDVSQITNMSSIFLSSNFNGDISQWDVSNVIDMSNMFQDSEFNGNISQWDVSNVKNIDGMFSQSKFNKDLSNWMPFKLESALYVFNLCPAPVPYWAIEETRQKAIDNYHLKKELEKELSRNQSKDKRVKI
jgi:surface protein